jgi:hypothetical protein
MPKVMCPNCGRSMSQSATECAGAEGYTVETATYRCKCRSMVTLNVETPIRPSVPGAAIGVGLGELTPAS